jgi:hypothetical protein
VIGGLLTFSDVDDLLRGFGAALAFVSSASLVVVLWHALACL